MMVLDNKEGPLGFKNESETQKTISAFVSARDVKNKLNLSPATIKRFRSCGILVLFRDEPRFYTYESYSRLKTYMENYRDNFGRFPPPRACELSLI